PGPLPRDCTDAAQATPVGGAGRAPYPARSTAEGAGSSTRARAEERSPVAGTATAPKSTSIARVWPRWYMDVASTAPIPLGVACRTAAPPLATIAAITWGARGWRRFAARPHKARMATIVTASQRRIA